MTTFEYNGIELEITKTRQYDRDAVYDGPTYIYTKHVIAIEAEYNPKATSYQLVNGTVNPREGEFPPTTDVAVRHKLMQPRSSLLYRSGGRTILQVVIDADTPTDCNNGPKPISCDVEEIQGEKRFRVRFTLECYINECDTNGRSDEPTVLSHRWTHEERIDMNLNSTLIMTGRIIFNTAILDRENSYPDFFRRTYVPKCPRGYKRISVNVTAGEDQNELRYSVIDRYNGYQILIPGITEVDCIVTAGFRKPSVMDQGLATFNFALGMSLGAVNGVEGVSSGRNRQGAISYSLGQVQKGTQQFTSAANGVNTTYHLSLNAYAVGAPTTPMTQVMDAAKAALKGRLRILDRNSRGRFSGQYFRNDTNATVDASNRTAQISESYTSGFRVPFFDAFQPADLDPYTLLVQNVPNTFTDELGRSIKEWGQRFIPIESSDQPLRGSSSQIGVGGPVTRLFSQYLQNDCEDPLSVPGAEPSASNQYYN